MELLTAELSQLFAELQNYWNDEEQQTEEFYYHGCTLVKQLEKKYTASEILQALAEYLNYLSEQEDIILFANLFFAFGFCDFKYDMPYPFIALLYKKVGLNCRKDSVDFKDETVFWSIAVTLVKNSGLYKGYPDQYEPFQDTCFIQEMQKLTADL